MLALTRFFYLVFLFLLITQNLFASILSQYDYGIARVFLGLKDLLVYVSLACYLFYLLYKGSVGIFPLALYALIFCILILPVFHGVFVFMSLRQLLLLPILLLFGFIISRILSFNDIFRPALYLSWFVLFTAFIEYLLHTDQEVMLIGLGVPEFIRMKGFDLWAYGPFGLPGNYYSFDLYAFFGGGVRRAVSILLEPTLLGQLLALPSFYYFLKKKYLAFALFFVGILLSVSKGGVLTVLCAIFLYLYIDRFNRTLRMILSGLVLLLSVLVYEVIVEFEVQSALNHINGLTENLKYLYMHPFGSGLGAAGNFANLNAKAQGSEAFILAGESFLGVLVGQIGIFGLVLYAYLIYFLLKLEAPTKSMLAVKYAGVATLFSAVFSESAISFVGGGMLFVLLGSMMQPRCVRFFKIS